MALTLSSGLTPEECLNLAADLIDQEEYRQRLSKCKESVLSGKDLCDTLLENGIFSGVYARASVQPDATQIQNIFYCKERQIGY